MTRNIRGLERSIERNKEGYIMSDRKRDATNVRQLNCKYLLVVLFKSVGKRNLGIKVFVLKVKNDTHHGHEIFNNPLLFTEHLKDLLEY